jgi:hypothetical protein
MHEKTLTRQGTVTAREVAGLTQEQACKAAGIYKHTLANWKEFDPELADRMEEAREDARRESLEAIKQAGNSTSEP